jgi:hypothetical protein
MLAIVRTITGGNGSNFFVFADQATLAAGDMLALQWIAIPIARTIPVMSSTGAAAVLCINGILCVRIMCTMSVCDRRPSPRPITQRVVSVLDVPAALQPAVTRSPMPTAHQHLAPILFPG